MNRNYVIKRNWILLLILFVSFLLRFYHLRFQSFGLDELHTMKESVPHFFSFREMIHFLKTNDQHPPLFFICERICLAVFGHSESVGRGFTALCGLLGVLAMYFFGKELAGKRLGLFAALLTCINYFCIFYSQETRDYSLSFLLSAISYRYFIRLVRNPDSRDMINYSVTTLALLYTHYFGLLIFGSQFLVAFILLFFEKDKKAFLFRFAISGAIIVLGFSLWLPGLKQVSDLQHFWIPPLTQDFIFEFFSEYFGNAPVLMPIVFLALTFFVIRVFLQDRRSGVEIKNDPLLLCFLLLTVSLTIVYMIPYVRSVLVVPMMISRYTMVVLPVILIAFAYGLDLIPNDIVRFLVMGLFTVLTFTDLLVIKKFYWTVRNTDYRDLSTYIASNSKKVYPIINERTGWQQAFYLRDDHYDAPILRGPRADMVDSILKKSSAKYNVDGFWLEDAFYVPAPKALLDATTQKALDSTYVLVKDSSFFDAWAQLYVKKDSSIKKLDTGNFAPNLAFTQNGERVILDLGGVVTSKPFVLSKGNYIVIVRASGQPGAGIYPHLVISINNQPIGDMTTDAGFVRKEFSYSMPVNSDTARISINMDNDYWDPVKREDRNAFIKDIMLIKQ